jgi:hypothetical protein
MLATADHGVMELVSIGNPYLLENALSKSET